MTLFNAETIRAEAAKRPRAAGRLPLIDLLQAERAGELRTFAPTTARLEIDPGTFAIADVAEMRALWVAGTPFKVLLTVPYRRKDDDAVLHGTIKILMRRAQDDEPPQVVFIREGCVLSRYRVHTRETIAFVEACSGATSAFFAHAEPPGRTDWETARIKRLGIFKGVERRMRLMRTCVPAIERICALEPSGDELPTAFDHLLTRPTEDRRRASRPETGAGPDDRDGITRPHAAGTPESEIPPAGDVDPTSPVGALSVLQREDGFRLRLRDPGALEGGARHLDLLCGYATRLGDAFEKHRPMDFSFHPGARVPVELEVVDGALEVIDANRLRVTITGPGFSLRASGFDTKRALEIELIDLDAVTSGREG